MDLKQGYVFVINTSEYAGNFEREMTAHCTGIIGECEVGEEFIVEEIATIFEPSIQHVNDDHGCARPCQCNGNDVFIYFVDKPTEEQIKLIKERSESFNEARKTTGRMAQFYQDSNIKILGYKLLEVSQEVKEFSI